MRPPRRPRKQRPALWGHDFEGSGQTTRFYDGEHERCFWCGWPYDEHPNHPSRYDNPRIVAVILDAKRSTVWG